MARTWMDAEFVTSVLNFWNISSPRQCLLTGKPLAGRVVQHLCIFVGCVVTDQTTDLEACWQGRGVYAVSSPDPMISQVVGRGFLHCYLQFA